MTIKTRKPPPAVTSRRHVIAGLAAAPAIALGSLSASVGASGAIETLRLGEVALNDIADRLDRLQRGLDFAENEVQKLLGPPRRLPPIPWGKVDFERRNYYVHQSSRRYKARANRLNAALGVNSLKKVIADVEAVRAETVRTMIEIAATDPAALMVKARLAKDYDGMAESFIDDMLVYFGRAA